MSESPPLEPLAPPPSPPVRWTDDPLPAYRHVPGLTPHPVRDPAGHSYGLEPKKPDPALQPAAAQRLPEEFLHNTFYLYGVDLFNRAFFWEAHEAWEEVWNEVGHRSIPGRMLQGMIQVSAALLKRHMGVPRGAEGNYRKARVHFSAVAKAKAPASPHYLGVDLRVWQERVEAYLLEPEAPFPFLELRVDHSGTAEPD